MLEQELEISLCGSRLQIFALCRTDPFLATGPVTGELRMGNGQFMLAFKLRCKLLRYGTNLVTVAWDAGLLDDSIFLSPPKYCLVPKEPQVLNDGPTKGTPLETAKSFKAMFDKHFLIPPFPCPCPPI